MNPISAALFALALSIALPAAAQTASDMEILAQKIKADKKLVVAANMDLTEAEAKAFWPVYDAYQAQLQAINQRIVDTVTSYADAYDKRPLSDATAKKLIKEAIAIDDAETRLRSTYVAKLEKIIPGVKVARYMQIESKIRAIIKYQLAASIPLAS